jgi:hypothetical protein
MSNEMKNSVLGVLGIIFLFFDGVFTRAAFKPECKGEIFLGVVIVICLCIIGFTLTIGLSKSEVSD